MSSSLDFTLWQALDTELVSMLDHFSNLIRSAQIPDEDADQSGSRDRAGAPADLMEIWSEKLNYSGLAALHITSQLKKGALLSDFGSLIESVRAARGAYDKQESKVNFETLPTIQREVQALLGELEHSYYSSEHRGKHVSSPLSDELRQLSELAMEHGEHRH